MLQGLSRLFNHIGFDEIAGSFYCKSWGVGVEVKSHVNGLLGRVQLPNVHIMVSDFLKLFHVKEANLLGSNELFKSLNEVFVVACLHGLGSS